MHLPEEVPEQVGLCKIKVRRKLQMLFALIFVMLNWDPFFLNQKIADLIKNHISNWNQYFITGVASFTDGS